MLNFKPSFTAITCIISTLTCFLFLALYVNHGYITFAQFPAGLRFTTHRSFEEIERTPNEFINPLMRSEASFQTAYKYICTSDKEKYDMIKRVDFENQTGEFLRSLFHKLISNPVGGRCANLQRFGGRYIQRCHYWDGHKFVCMPELINDIGNNECVVYSFGISNDWSFEKAMGKIGCKVFAFDPTVDHPKELEENVWFEKLGLSVEKDEARSLDSLSSILHTYGHKNTKISYLKIDIEGGEADGLQHWFESGALANVQQIGMEYHIKDTDSAVKFFTAIKQLHVEANFRLISFDVNGCYGKEKADYPKLAEIVLMRSSENSFCAD